MKCPFLLRRAPYDGGEQCDPDCGLMLCINREVTETHYRDVKVCGLLDKESRKNAANFVYSEWKERGEK